MLKLVLLILKNDLNTLEIQDKKDATKDKINTEGEMAEEDKINTEGNKADREEKKINIEADISDEEEEKKIGEYLSEKSEIKRPAPKREEISTDN